MTASTFPTPGLVLQLFGYDQHLATLAKTLQLTKLGYKDTTITQGYIHGETNPEMGELTPTFKGIDEKLEILSAEALTQLGSIPVNDRTWDKVLSTLMQSPLIEPMWEIPAVDRNDLWLKKETIWSGVAGRQDPAVVNEVEGWLKRLINDDAIWTTTNMNHKAVTEMVAQIGGAVDTLWDLLPKSTWQEKAVIDIGIMRFPDPLHPYFKVYRIHLKAWVSSKTAFFQTTKSSGITGTYNCRQFQPRLEIVKEMQLEAKERLINEANALMSKPSPLGPSPSSPDSEA